MRLTDRDRIPKSHVGKSVRFSDYLFQQTTHVHYSSTYYDDYAGSSAVVA